MLRFEVVVGEMTSSFPPPPMEDDEASAEVPPPLRGVPELGPLVLAVLDIVDTASRRACAWDVPSC